MIRHGDKEIATVQWGRRSIAAIYKGLLLVWEYARSCFGKGYWINNLEWNNKDAWKNN